MNVVGFGSVLICESFANVIGEFQERLLTVIMTAIDVEKQAVVCRWNDAGSAHVAGLHLRESPTK